MTTTFYADGGYLKNHPTWLVEDSPWKAEQVLKMLNQHQLKINSVCEIGCGAGEILRQLYLKLPQDTQFMGYEVSPQALALCEARTQDRLKFKLSDCFSEADVFDLALCLDVFEHVDDYFSFLESLREKATYKIFHIPLDISVSTVARGYVLEKSWQKSGHIHFFTKEVALKALAKTGYVVKDYFYTPYYIDCCSKDSLKAKLMTLPRKLLYAINPDFAVRMIGGYALLVLAE
jgi:ubiquinone/menaquinone biosynthesis C-methylase UbiE